ncbi:MAG: phosphodiester glycosidase family protein [Myxococcota bacterium]
MFLLLIPIANALTLTIQSEHTPYSGVTIQHYRATNPDTDVTVAIIELCAEGIHLDATHIEDSTRSVASWANLTGVQVAMNGDFFRSGPTRVYGDAVGNGVAWPSLNTGLNSAYASEWYFQKYGWIAFGHDWVDYTYTQWIKNNPEQFAVPVGGWEPETVAPSKPSGTIAMVSGFPTLVMEGVVLTCTSPTASDCFPDRTDMRVRHPRSAVGLTADKQRLIMVAVDGRTSNNSGMYGSELAELMGQLGAHFAINLDGGGSTQLWSDGYLNSPSETYRSVANHMGVFAGGSSGRSNRPGHCETQSACQSLSPAGGIIDNSSECFVAWGPSQYWRTESQGHDAQLLWTNAFSSDVASNWAWWQLSFEEAGQYDVEYYATADFAVHDAVPHLIVAGGQAFEFLVDQSSASGWTDLGTFDFAEGGRQFVALYDNNTGSVPSNQHIVADAIRLTRVGEWCGDGVCDEDEGCECPEDCALDEEIPDNGIDDDCDGSVDPSTECGENETASWCLDESLLGVCLAGSYSEHHCSDNGQICSENTDSCVDSVCYNRENESWCEGNVVNHCTGGVWFEETCSEDEVCVQGICGLSDDFSDDPSSPNQPSESKKSGACSGSGVALLWCFGLIGLRARLRTEIFHRD